ncbi:MAG TPA: glycosyltransferase family 4 protein [Candidatus Lokiarchaeia archaeon]
MKILFIQPTADKRGHYGIYTVNLCQELAKLKNEVLLFTNKVYPERYLSEKPLFKIIEAKAGKYQFEKFDQSKKKHPFYYQYGYLRNSFIILKLAFEFLKESHFDVVQILDTEYGILSFLLKIYKKFLPPVVLLIQAANFSFHKYSGSFFIRIYKNTQRRILKSCLGKEIKAVNTLGEYHKEELKKQFDLKENFPIRIIYDGANPPAVHPNKKEARRKIGINYKGTIFLFFGMLRKDKGMKYFFEAISFLKNQDFKVLIAGCLFDYHEPEILALIEKLGIKDKIILRLGYIDDKKIYHYFFASDVLVLPYIKTYTGGSGPLLKEAAVCKIPSIVSDVSEMGRLVKRNKMGLIAEPENPESLAEKMKEFLEMSEKQRKELGENAFKAANTWQKMAKEYSEFFKEILAKK